MKNTKHDLEERTVIAWYKCGYCSHKFRHGAKRINHFSTRVTCPNCKNHLKTWEDIHKIIEEK